MNYTASVFYRGLAYMQTNDHMNAIADFTAVANAGQTNLAADAQWFLALCYLKVGEETDAKDILTTIAKSNPYDGEKATELLSQL
jgi:tetratricopeptide (TPR) repeat protein